MGIRILTKDELRQGLVARRPEDHKGVFGHALIVGGSREMAGAAILAARAALRSGAGLVTVAAPAGAATAVAGAVPGAMTLHLPENAAGALRPSGVTRLKSYVRERRVTSLGVGPGLSAHVDATDFVWRALSETPLPAVVDADALNALAARELSEAVKLMKERKFPCIFTPHPGEMGRLLRLKKDEVELRREETVARLARELGGVAVLKGRGTLISSGGRTVINLTGGPALAKGGSGDILTGLIAGLWAQALGSGRPEGDVAFHCAALGAWLHGTAGDLAGSEMTPWAATASDVIESLPRAFKALCS